jgi:hypothetical protein
MHEDDRGSIDKVTRFPEGDILITILETALLLLCESKEYKDNLNLNIY